MTCEYQVWSEAPAYGGMYKGQVGSICRCGKPAKMVETFVTTRRGQPTGKRKKVWLCEAHAEIVADNVGFVKAEKA